MININELYEIRKISKDLEALDIPNNFYTKADVDRSISLLDSKITSKFNESKSYTDNKFNEGKSYTDRKISEIVGSSPEALNTLYELAGALGNNPNFSTDMLNLIGGKADKTHNHDSVYLGKTATAASATKLATARTINGVAFDGTSNITISANPSSHTHDDRYLKLTGGELNGELKMKGHSFIINKPVTTGGWARGISFKSTDGATTLGGFGMHGSGDSVTSVYMGLGETSYTGSGGLIITNTDIKFKGHKVYHAGSKPTASELGVLPLTGGTLTGNLVLNRKSVYPSFGTSITGNSSAESLSPGLSIIDTNTTDNGYAYSYGTVLNVNAGSIARQYQLLINNTSRFAIRSSHNNNQSENKWSPWYKVYTELEKPTPAELGVLPLTGGTLTGSLTLHNTGAKFTATSHTWVGGKTTNNALAVVTGINTTGYFPIIRMNHQTGNVSNIGVISNKVGFWGYLSSRTENGTDAEAYLDIGTNTFVANKFSGNGVSITGVNALSLNGRTWDEGALIHKIASRDVNADLHARLFRSTYANQSNISGAMAFRVNNSSDNYIRFCSDPASIRNWLGAAASSHTHDDRYYTESEINTKLDGKANTNLVSTLYKRFDVGGDANTYYPVLINPTSKSSFGFYKMNISRAYNWKAPDTWNTATHRGGLTLCLELTGDSAWGGNDKNIRVREFAESYTTMVGGLVLSTSGLLVWLRGGGATYQIDGDYGNGYSVQVNLGSFTASDNTVYAVRTNTNSVNSEVKLRHCLREDGRVYDRGSRVYSNSNKPSPADIGAAPSSHSHSYLPLSGGTLTGHLRLNSGLNVYLPNNYGIAGKDTTGSDRYMMFMDTSNRIHIGYNKINNVVIDASSASITGLLYSEGLVINGNESKFSTGTYTDPTPGVSCSAKFSGNMATSHLYVGLHRFDGWWMSNSTNVSGANSGPYVYGISSDCLYFRTYNQNGSGGRDNTCYLGSSGTKFKGIYLGSQPSISSDMRMKRNISYNEDNDEKLEIFYDNLKPSSYSMKDGDTGRTHFGFIAQEVEEAMELAGMSYKDCAFLQKSPRDENGDEIQPYTVVSDPYNPGEFIKEFLIQDYEKDKRIKDYEYALAYSELISVNTHFIQDLRKRVTTLEDENRNLKEEVAELKNKFKEIEVLLKEGVRINAS